MFRTSFASVLSLLKEVDHKLPLIVAVLIIIYLGLNSLVGEHYSSAVLEVAAAALVGIGLFLRNRKGQAAVPALPHPKPKFPLIEIPVSDADCRQAIAFVHAYYAKKNTPVIPADVMFEAFQKNRYSIICVKDSQLRIRGCVELWAVRGEVGERLKAGTVAENKLSANDFRSYTRDLRSFYIAITLPTPNAAHRALLDEHAHLLIMLLQVTASVMEKSYLKGTPEARYTSARTINLFGIADSKEGANLMKKLNFIKDDEISKSRSDGRDVYVLEVDLRFIRNIRRVYGLNSAAYPVRIDE